MVPPLANLIILCRCPWDFTSSETVRVCVCVCVCVRPTSVVKRLVICLKASGGTGDTSVLRRHSSGFTCDKGGGEGGRGRKWEGRRGEKGEIWILLFHTFTMQ